MFGSLLGVVMKFFLNLKKFDTKCECAKIN